ncbi:hypothetical protein KIL84_000857 [Mauremys mutica]|uniref:Uncharacterized protein n=1 Tax=Mauremys mutica TaxID=74926 RepID=A0A9D4ANT9_9SAUR|nr:hypothetical protein KIL84_000857 [Mauremys mutica]
MESRSTLTEFPNSVPGLLLLVMYSVTLLFILEKNLICVISVAETVTVGIKGIQFSKDRDKLRKVVATNACHSIPVLVGISDTIDCKWKDMEIQESKSGQEEEKYK